MLQAVPSTKGYLYPPDTFKATFSDGTMVENSQYGRGRNYTIATHAWLVRFIKPNGKLDQWHGFCCNERNAARNAENQLKPRKAIFAEVVAIHP